MSVLETKDNLVKEINRLAAEIERLKKVMKISPNEALAAGFIKGLAYRPGLALDEFDRKMLARAGDCISRIMNEKEAEHD